jgi:hypothetical protein
VGLRNEWKQTTNPYTTDGAPTGYEPIQIDMPHTDTQNAFGGFQRGIGGGAVIHNYDAAHPSR